MLSAAASSVPLDVLKLGVNLLFLGSLCFERCKFVYSLYLDFSVFWIQQIRSKPVIILHLNNEILFAKSLKCAG